jgi:hypothetical protein
MFKAHFLKCKSGQILFYSNQTCIAFSKSKTEIRIKRKENRTKKKERVVPQPTWAVFGAQIQPS